jgi:hypothetical protein
MRLVDICHVWWRGEALRDLLGKLERKKQLRLRLRLLCESGGYPPNVPTEAYCQGWPLGGASRALAPGADFEGAPKRRSPPGHTLIRSTVAWRRRSRDNWKYAWLAQITFQLCLRSVVDASWSGVWQICIYRGGRQLFALPRLSHGQRPALHIVPTPL